MPPLLPLCRVLVVAGRLALTAGPFFGEKLTIADLCATGLCRMILTGNFDQSTWVLFQYFWNTLNKLWKASHRIHSSSPVGDDLISRVLFEWLESIKINTIKYYMASIF